MSQDNGRPLPRITHDIVARWSPPIRKIKRSGDLMLCMKDKADFDARDILTTVADRGLALWAVLRDGVLPDDVLRIAGYEFVLAADERDRADEQQTPAGIGSWIVSWEAWLDGVIDDRAIQEARDYVEAEAREYAEAAKWDDRLLRAASLSAAVAAMMSPVPWESAYYASLHAARNRPGMPERQVEILLGMIGQPAASVA